MLYPAIIHKDAETDFGLILPDFPGLFSGGASLAEAIANAQEAVELFYAGEPDPAIPAPGNLEELLAAQEGGALLLIDLNFDFLNKSSLPENSLRPLPKQKLGGNAARAAGL